MEPNELPDELASIRNTNTYTAPANYFDGLANEILSKVHLPLVAATPLSAPPANYFNNLADAILLKVKNGTLQSDVQKELEETEPALALIQKINPYRVPQGYFESFTVSVPTIRKAAPVIQMQHHANWLRYASAAVVTGIIAIGIIFFAKENGNNGIDSSKYNTALAKVSDNAISDYLDNTSTDADLTPAASQESSNVTDSESLYELLLNNVSDNEIQDYLNANDDSDEKDSKGI